MNKTDPKQEEIPAEFASLELAGEFWDTHSTADYEGLVEPVAVELNLPVRITNHGRGFVPTAVLPADNPNQ
jgi:hypothetical protein